MSGDKDHHRRVGQRLDKLHSVEIGHADVGEYHVGIPLVDKRRSLNCAGKLSHKLEKRHFRHITFQLFERDRFVVDYYSADFHDLFLFGNC